MQTFIRTIPLPIINSPIKESYVFPVRNANLFLKAILTMLATGTILRIKNQRPYNPSYPDFNKIYFVMNFSFLKKDK